MRQLLVGAVFLPMLGCSLFGGPTRWDGTWLILHTMRQNSSNPDTSSIGRTLQTTASPYRTTSGT